MGHSVLASRVLRSALGLAFIAGSTFSTGILSASAATPASTTYPTPAVQTAGQVTSVAGAAKQAPASQRGPRKVPGSRASAAVQSTAGQVSGKSSDQAGSGGQLLQAFNGVSSLDSELTNMARFEPPDQGLCEGNGFVLEAVNSAYTVYRTNGHPILGPINVNLPPMFHRGYFDFTSDPRCYYDPTTNTWFAIILYLSTDAQGNFSGQSTVDISVNTSGDPTTNWTTYSIDTSDAANTANGCPCFGDQPRFGIDQYNLYLSTDEFSINGPNWNGAQLYAVSKSDLIHLKSTIHFAHFTNPLINGQQVLAIEPATTNGPANAEYFIGALDSTQAFPGPTFSQIAVWAMTDRARVAQGRAPKLSSLVIGSEAYTDPPGAKQKGSDLLLNTNDDRMQQAQFINGTLWSELDTGIQITGDGAQRAAAAWFAVQPSIGNGVISSAAMARQGYLASSGGYLLFPAVQADAGGNAAMTFTLSGSQRYPSAAFATLAAGGSNFGPIQVAAEGTGPYVVSSREFPNSRWGDYSYASLDAASDTVWLATEYIPPLSSQTTTRTRNWGTEVMQVSLKQ